MTIAQQHKLRAPFPWYGGKRRVAEQVWNLLGNVDRYIEPFAGSLGVLLGRPQPFKGVEVVNDIDGYIVNAWRAIKHAPDETAEHAIDLIAELDLTARHLWLVNEGREQLKRLAADPEWYDAKIAGWWLQGIAAWIGSGYCSGNGPWTRAAILGSDGDDGRGVNRQLPHLGNDGQDNKRNTATVAAYMRHLASRLQNVIIATGEWHRITTPSAMSTRNVDRVGVFLDPPYREHGDEYGANSDTEAIWQRIEQWTQTVPDNVAVVLCGYDGDFTPPAGWHTIAYTAKGTSTSNATRERFWCSPACRALETTLF